MKKQSNGLLISLIGIDGSGKTTCAANLCLELRAKGFTCAYSHYNYPLMTLIRSMVKSGIRKYVSPMRDSSGSKIETSIPQGGRKLKNILWLFLASADMIVERLMKIRSSSRKSIMIYDRYFYDHLVNYLDGLPEWLVKLYLYLVPQPDLVILLDVSEAVAYRRKKEGSPSFLRWQRELYIRLARQLNMHNFLTVNANADIGEVNTSIFECVCSLLEGRYA